MSSLYDTHVKSQTQPPPLLSYIYLKLNLCSHSLRSRSLTKKQLECDKTVQEKDLIRVEELASQKKKKKVRTVEEVIAELLVIISIDIIISSGH